MKIGHVRLEQRLDRQRRYAPHGAGGWLRRSSIWRGGEGHVKLWVAVFFFAVGAAAMRQILVRTDLIGQLGSASFLPNIVGWSSAAWIVVILMALWYLVTGWNEQRQKPMYSKCSASAA
jgi:uncharacterized protein